MKLKRVHFILTAVALMIAILVFYGFRIATDFNYYQQAISTVSISSIDFDGIADGTYEGAFDARIVAVKVRLTVKDGVMTDLRILEHKNGRGQSAESIVNSVLTNQSLDVDVVSGATSSSRAILKATQNALESVPK